MFQKINQNFNLMNEIIYFYSTIIKKQGSGLISASSLGVPLLVSH